MMKIPATLEEAATAVDEMFTAAAMRLGSQSIEALSYGFSLMSSCSNWYG